MMKFYTWFRPELHTFDYAKRVIQAGIDGFEVVSWESYFAPEVYREYLANIRRIKEELNVGFSVHAPITDLHLGSLNSKVREISLQEMKASIELAREIGASVVTMHAAPGILAMPPGKWSKEEYHLPRTSGNFARQEQLVVRAVQDLADSAPDLLIGLENLVYPHELYRSPEELQDLIHQVNRSNVGLTLDVGHAVVAGQRPTDFMNLLFDDLFHIHLHDNHGVVDEHLPLGQGSIDYIGVVSTLKKLDYQGVVNFEFRMDNPDDYRELVNQFKNLE
ncbi:MAG: sugar phosphate isomerase/epimerase [Firmicutes bacterium]|nr:sugar phosphate isomerase/epimerase [Bacillota bacterium]